MRNDRLVRIYRARRGPCRKVFTPCPIALKLISSGQNSITGIRSVLASMVEHIRVQHPDRVIFGRKLQKRVCGQRLLGVGRDRPGGQIPIKINVLPRSLACGIKPGAVQKLKEVLLLRVQNILLDHCHVALVCRYQQKGAMSCFRRSTLHTDNLTNSSKPDNFGGCFMAVIKNALGQATTSCTLPSKIPVNSTGPAPSTLARSSPVS